MKTPIIFGVFIFAFLWASAASGAIYSWKDENGVMHFTNVAPPPQARIVVKNAPVDNDEGDNSAEKESVDERLERAEDRVEDLEQDLDQAEEKAREALQRAEALEARLAESNAEEAQFVQEAIYRVEKTWEEGYSSSPYYGGYVYRTAPFYRWKNCRPDRGKRPPISHYRKARHKKPYHGAKSRGGLKSRRYNMGVNAAKTQSERVFNQTRRNTLRSDLIGRRALY